MAEEVKLFTAWFIPFALRVVWTLKIKGIEYEAIEEDLTNKSPLLLHNNPIYKKVPVLVHNGKSLCESSVILEYIDETWKQTPLLPQDPYEKTIAHFWAKFGDDKLLPSIWKCFVTQEKELEEAIVAAMENLKFIEEQLKEKKFFNGQTIGYLDLAFGSLVNFISILEEVAHVKLVDAERFPLLSDWIQNFSDAPVIREYWPPRDKMVAVFPARRENLLTAAAPK